MDFVAHGLSDGVLSANDTAQWYDSLSAANPGHPSNFACLFIVPGTNHCRGDATSDQFDLVNSMVKWLKRGQAPDSVLASAPGAGNACGVNRELSAGLSATCTYALCAHPYVTRYKGSGNIEDTANFECR